jgi:hypothetical protein
MHKSTRKRKEPGWYKDLTTNGRNKGKQRETEVPEDEDLGGKRGGRKRRGKK